jgi:hypothetical protein
MHPWMALWMWSMIMCRILQDSILDREFVMPDIRIATNRLASIAVNAGNYLKSEVTEYPLPEIILDRLADLHWIEIEPALPI